MEKESKLAVSAIAVAIAAVFGAPGPAAAAEPVEAQTAVQLYGHLDISVDDATKGIGSGRLRGDGTPAQGRLGWQPDISSNLSYFGLRGNHDLGGGTRMVFQFESQVDVTATPGPQPNNNSATDSKIPAALGSRNSFLGLAGGFGAVKFGKSDAPYKLSTSRMDPFSATVGDYNSIMGNTGGDNRAEFDTRVSHAMWYESPKMGAFSFSALVSPGQNRSMDNSIGASGEPDCTGGNLPGAPGPTGGCNDGSFDNLYSVAGVYQSGPLYATAAYELHKNVNRATDEAANGGAAPDGSIGIADEKAAKFGIQYVFPTKTTVNAIYERLTRNAPDPNFNERQRNGYWFALTQKITPEDDFNLGWAHAGKTPGDVGTNRADGTLGQTGPGDNASNMYSVGYKHHYDKQATWYVVYARQANHNAAHFDLGASGHGITTDCHDGGQSASCIAGTTIQAVSFGMTYNF